MSYTDPEILNGMSALYFYKPEYWLNLGYC